MAYPMIALTTDGTSFACAPISLTDTGLAVLDDNGSRAGFAPVDSLADVAPTEESRVDEAPMQVRVEDGSTFGAASLSQTSAGVAVLNYNESRVGFVPNESLRHALPDSMTGPTLPADATPPDGVEIDEEDDGGSPVWEGDCERSDEHEGTPRLTRARRPRTVTRRPESMASPVPPTSPTLPATGPRTASARRPRSPNSSSSGPSATTSSDPVATVATR